MLLFTWFENPRVSDEGLHYMMWFLVHDSGRVLAIVDGPTKIALCYEATVAGNACRLYIHLEGAQEWCEREARILLSDEMQQKALKHRNPSAVCQSTSKQ